MPPPYGHLMRVSETQVCCAAPGPKREAARCLFQLRLHLQRTMNGGEEGKAGKKFPSRFPRKALQVERGLDKKQKPVDRWLEGMRSYQFSSLCRFKNEVRGSSEPNNKAAWAMTLFPVVLAS